MARFLGRSAESGAVGGKAAPVLYRALVRAVRRESVVAVCHWFGPPRTPSADGGKLWGSGSRTRGRFRLKSRHSKEPWAVAARTEGVGQGPRPGPPAEDRGVQAGQAATKACDRGHAEGANGQAPSPEVRKKMSAFLKERAKVFVPSGRLWTAAEDELVRTLPPPEVARQTNRSLDAVYYRRRRLGVPDGRTTQGPTSETG